MVMFRSVDFSCGRLELSWTDFCLRKTWSRELENWFEGAGQQLYKAVVISWLRSDEGLNYSRGNPDSEVRCKSED